jgi:hypothetical protein
MGALTAGTTLGGKAIKSRHQVGTTFPAADSAVTWASPLTANAPSARSCVNMCHGDHPHDLTSPVVATHEYNAYVDATSQTSRGGTTRTSATRAKTDFDSTQTNGGMCISCHRFPVDPFGVHPAIGQAAYASSAHNYSTNFVSPNTYSWTYTQHDGGVFQRNCTKCHAERADTRPGDASIPFESVHDSSNPSLLAGNVPPAAAGNVVAEMICYNCHGDGTNGQNLSGRNMYGEVTSAFGHPVNSDAAHNTATEAVATSFTGITRHVNCQDCHEPHQAQAVGSSGRGGTITAYAANATTGDTLTDSSKAGASAWTANAFRGWTLKMVSGAQAGLTSAIYANATNTLTVRFATAPAVGDRYLVTPTGARVAASAMPPGSPAMLGAWGVAPTFGAAPTPPSWNDSGGCGATGTAASCQTVTASLATNTYAKSALNPPPEAYVCMKCHSAFAYGTTPPNSPSGMPNATASTWSNTSGGTWAESDISRDANPNNLGHHAIFARGKNQPMVSSATLTSVRNPNWPSFTTGTITGTVGSASITLSGGTWPVTLLPGWFIYIGNAAPANPSAGWYEVASVQSTTQLTLDRTCAGTCSGAYFLTAGLGNTFVPPWGPWSVLECSDCHRSSTLTDPLGPHGSTTKWMLRGAATQSFLGQTTSTGAIGTVTNTPADANNICINCHRRDVYGDYGLVVTPRSPVAGAVYTFSRQNHPADKDNGSSASYRTMWGIMCFNCHGGARQGGIHGLNLGIGNNGTTAASYSGRRLLAGSSWYAVTRSSTTTAGTCFTKGATDAVDNCGHAHGGVAFQSGTANYDYESTASPGTTP